jgi:Domain of unknown function (DUF4432)
MIALESDTLAVRIDGTQGAEIRSLIRRAGELELLVQTPWPSAEARVPASGDEWTRRWRGGWQLLTPNAGNECVVGGRRHGCHGDASLLPWRLLEEGDHFAELAWRDVSGLAVERRIALEGPRVIVTSRIVNDADEPLQFLLGEHLVFGPPLAGPGVRIDAPATAIVPLDPDTAVPIGPVVRWPMGAADWSRPPDRPFTHFGAFATPEPRALRVANERAGIAATVEWSGAALPHLWFWHEHRVARLVDDWPITCLGLEPATTARGTGLAEAIEAGEAIVLAPRSTTSTETVLTVE